MDEIKGPDTIQRWEISKTWQVKTDKSIKRLEEGQEDLGKKIDRLSPLEDAAEGLRSLGKFGAWSGKWIGRVRRAVVWLLPVATFASVCYGLYKAWPVIQSMK